MTFIKIYRDFWGWGFLGMGIWAFFTLYPKIAMLPPPMVGQGVIRGVEAEEREWQGVKSGVE